jgi:hypothetical protein
LALALTCSLLSSASYCVGSRLDPDLKFLDAGRAPTGDEAFTAYPIEYALKSVARDDVIFLGDSVCHFGIDPERFRKITGLSAFNLASYGFMGPVGFPITAKAYFSRHPKPRALVLCVSAISFDVDPALGGGSIPDRFEVAYAPEVGFGSAHLTLAQLTRSGVHAATGWAMGAGDVRELPLMGMEKETYRTLQKRWLATKGFFPLPDGVNVRHRIDLLPPVAFIRNDWDCGIQRLVEECAAAGVPLVIRFCPLSDEFKSIDVSPVERWADDFRKRFPTVTIATPTVLWYAPSLSWDGIHLNAAGVEKFMPVVAADVKSALGRRDVRP